MINHSERGVTPVISLLLILAITIVIFTSLQFISFDALSIDDTDTSGDLSEVIGSVQISEDGRVMVTDDLDGAVIVVNGDDIGSVELTEVGDSVQSDNIKNVVAKKNNSELVIYTSSENPNMDFDSPDPGEPKGEEGSINDGELPGEGEESGSNVELTSIDISPSKTNKGSVKGADIKGSISSKRYEVTVTFDGKKSYSQEVTDDGDFSKDDYNIGGNSKQIPVTITVTNVDSGSTELTCDSSEDLSKNNDLDSVSKFNCE